MTKNQLVTQNQILQKELDDKATWRILEILSDEKLRDARREIYTYRRNYDASNAPEEIRITTCYYNPNTAEQNLGLVKSKFGLIGEILKTDIHVSERVFDLYADTITLVWYAVEPEIKKYRVRHDDQRHMIHFEWLNEQSLKWYAVKKMSPPKFF